MLKSSRSNSKSSKKGTEAGNKLGLSPDYMTLEPRIWYSAQSPAERTINPAKAYISLKTLLDG
jgi:hypothetical protein